MSNEIKEYINQFKKNYRYSPTQLGKIERIENYVLKLEQIVKDNGVIFSCNNCEWFKVCPHSYKETDYKESIEQALIMLDELNIMLKDMMDEKLDIKEILDIKEVLKGNKIDKD